MIIELVLLIWGIMKLVFAIALTIFSIVGFVFSIVHFANEKKPIKPTKEVLAIRARVDAELKERRWGYR